MKHLDAIIVVEGTTDQALLSGFLDAEIVTTNGSAVSRETIDYLKTASEHTSIIVMTDPDFPGQRIRSIIEENVPGVQHVFLPKEKCIKHHKVGVAESDMATILEGLENIIGRKNEEKGTLSAADLNELKITGHPMSSAIRDRICREFHLGKANGKTILRRLNTLGLTVETLKEFIDGQD